MAKSRYECKRFFGEESLDEDLPLAKAEDIITLLEETVENAVALKLAGDLDKSAIAIAAAHSADFNRVHNLSSYRLADSLDDDPFWANEHF